MLNNNSIKRRKNYWTKNETELLKEAVSKYGKKWSIIQQKYPEFKENNRSQIDLKDKWRNLEGRNKFSLDSGDRETLDYIVSRRIKSKRPKRSKSKRSKSKRSKSKRSKRRSKRRSKSKRSKSKRSKSKRSKSRKINKAKYIIYSKEGCPYCRDAKELLKSKNIPFKEIKVTDSNIEKIYKKIDNKTKKYRYFPIIFKNNIFIGGFSDLDKNNL